MEDWFTVEEIDADTFAISEYRHWEETHGYLLCGAQKAILIDTGLGVSDIREVTDRLTALPVMVLTTHAHWDHIGGHSSFQRVAVHEAEAAWLSERFPLPLETVRNLLTCRPCRFPASFSVDRYHIFHSTKVETFRDGDGFDLGGRRLTVFHTPGHSPGHCCFYEPERGYLYSGDLIYAGCLDAFYPTTDPRLFYQSVRRMDALPVNRLLPGHHCLEVSPDCVHRVRQAFHTLDCQGRLKPGQGVSDFGEFQIHL